MRLLGMRARTPLQNRRTRGARRGGQNTLEMAKGASGSGAELNGPRANSVPRQFRP